MDISNTAGLPASGSKSKGASFSEALGKKDGAAPQLMSASSKSSAAVDLAAGLGSMSTDFTPEAGDGMFEVMGLAEGAADEMRRYEERMNQR